MLQDYALLFTRKDFNIFTCCLPCHNVVHRQAVSYCIRVSVAFLGFILGGAASARTCAHAQNDRMGEVIVQQCFCARSANSPARMRYSAQIDTPLSSRARALWRSFFLLFYTASVPAFHPAETFMTCLTLSGPFSFFF